jgi:hypothetical protein
MYTDDVIFFRPTRHELLNVSVVKRFVKALFDVVGCSTHDGCLQFGSFHDPTKSTRAHGAPGNKKPDRIAASGF